MNADIAFLGDIHGFYNRLLAWPWGEPFPKQVIQVGDFGFFHIPGRECKVNPPYPMMFIEGNHDSIEHLRNISDRYSKVAKICGGEITYVPRGWVTEIEGKTVGFLGGAESIDQGFRKQGVNWFPDEGITVSDLYRLNENMQTLDKTKIDILVTHTPPEFVVKKEYGITEMSGPSAKLVERAMEEWWPELLISGHMHYHRELKAAGTKIVVLGTNEWYHPAHGFQQLFDNAKDMERLVIVRRPEDPTLEDDPRKDEVKCIS